MSTTIEKKTKKAAKVTGLPENLKKAIAKKKAATEPKVKKVNTKAVKKVAVIDQTLTSIALTRIIPNPHNPRKNFEGKTFDALVASIRQKGVITPIMVRPSGKKDEYEIVYGERRFRACARIAKENGGKAKHEIPALVRTLNDDESFDLMTIENLQREDLTELEEAQSFKSYVDRNGADSVIELSERTGILPTYIRRRIIVMQLPDFVLVEWDKGHLKFGHLEQLAKLGDNEARIKELLAEVLEGMQWRDVMTVERLKNMIHSESPSLEFSLFDPKKEGCMKCFHNSQVQKSLFEFETTDEIKCNKPECFEAKKKAHIAANWDAVRKEHSLTTNGFSFYEDHNNGDYQTIGSWQNCTDKCKACENYKSLFYLNRTKIEPACFGDDKCYQTEVVKGGDKTAKGKSDGSGSAGEGSGPRVAWHGEHFRDKFYTDRLAEKVKEQPSNDFKVQQMALFSLVKNNGNIGAWFAKESGLRKEDKIDHYTYLHDDEIWEHVLTLDAEKVADLIKEAVIQYALTDSGWHEARMYFGKHIGLDLSKEFAIDAEYLGKKVKSEIVDLIADFKLLEDKNFTDYLANEQNCFPDDIEKLKKGQLVDAFLKSGVDLVGRVPAEVLAKN